MRILIEEHQYRAEVVDNIIVGLTNLRNIKGKVSVNHVGYYYNPELGDGEGDTVFILPKVLLEDVDGEELLFGKYHPEDVIELGTQQLLSKEEYDFLYELAVWIYRAIVVFRDSHPDSDVVLQQLVQRMSTGRLQECNTYLDILLALQRFNRDNEDFFFFVLRNQHSGFNKINWTRTISHSQAMMQEDSPVYLNPVNKRRQVNFDEELLVIFFSILNYMHGHYGFPVHIPVNFELIAGSRFEAYLNGQGRLRLLKIKHKYFSDKALYLWELCYAFFDLSRRVKVEVNEQEYVLVKNFNIVFEAMIDELIGTPHDRIPKGLADQEDGKRVDHLYTDLALTSANGQTDREVYYIGDSKYYKSGRPLDSKSIYKQYTYARNVIQWNINLFLSDDTAFDKEELQDRQYDRIRNGIHLQDDNLTEGYDVMPNFFISAFVYDNHEYVAQENIRKHLLNDGKHCTHVSYQFPDRLFDRDTLFLSQYDVNFLYVLYLYARNKANEKTRWKEHVRKIFRDEIREVVQAKFRIYAMRSRLGVDGALYLQQHFYELNGRVFQPYGEERTTYFAYARPTDKIKETQAQFDELEKYFLIEPCGMGQDPQEVMKEKVETEMQKPVDTPQWLTLHYLERYPDKGIMLGYYKSEEHLRWIMGNNDKGSLVYNVRLKLKDDKSPRKGAYSSYYYEEKDVQFVILYTDGVEQTGEYRVFHVKDKAAKVSEERMRETWYPFDTKGPYFFFRFDEEVTLGRLRIAQLLHDLRTVQADYQDGEPLFTTGKDLMSYRER